MKPGRKSAAELAIVPVVERIDRLQPPPGLAPAVEAQFRRTVAECAADHFVASDMPMLVGYCEAVEVRKRAFTAFAQETELYAFQLWQQATNTMSKLATKLRLCPSSRSDPKTVGRRRMGPGVSYYDLMADEGE